MSRRFRTISFYTLMAGVSLLGVIVGSYLILRQQSSLGFLVFHSDTTYMFWFLLLTVMSAVLCAVNVVLFVYQTKRYGVPVFGSVSGTGGGAILSIFSSLCPVCGSTIIAGLSIVGGISTLPLKGLEIKIGGLIILFFMTVWMWKTMERYACTSSLCPIPRSAAYHSSDRIWVISALLLLIVLGSSAWKSAQSDPFFSNDPAHQSLLYQCSSKGS